MDSASEHARLWKALGAAGREAQLTATRYCYAEDFTRHYGFNTDDHVANKIKLKTAGILSALLERHARELIEVRLQLCDISGAEQRDYDTARLLSEVDAIILSAQRSLTSKPTARSLKDLLRDDLKCEIKCEILQPYLDIEKFRADVEPVIITEVQKYAASKNDILTDDFIREERGASSDWYSNAESIIYNVRKTMDPQNLEPHLWEPAPASHCNPPPSEHCWKRAVAGSFIGPLLNEERKLWVYFYDKLVQRSKTTKN